MTEPTKDNKRKYPFPHTDATRDCQVKVICGGRDEIWVSKDVAYEYYSQLCAHAEEPRMKKAYQKICSQLKAGQKICTQYPMSKRKKESIRDEINAEKFNYMDFCKEDYDAAKDSQNFDEVIGRISIGKILIKLRKTALRQVRAEFYVIDRLGSHGRTEDGQCFEHAQNMQIVFDGSIDYGSFRKRLDKSLIHHIDNYECKYFCLWDKVLHIQGERVGIEGEMMLGEHPVWVSSGATILEDESYEAKELYCRIDDVEGSTVECAVPIRMFISPFSDGYGRFMKEQKLQPMEAEDMHAGEILPSSVMFHGWEDIERMQDLSKWETLCSQYEIPMECKEQLFKTYPTLEPEDTVFYIELSRDKYEQYINTAALSSGGMFRNFGTGWHAVRQVPEAKRLKGNEVAAYV